MSIHSTGIGKHDPRVADIITATIPEFCRISGIGRSKTYELIASGVIESIRCGNRRLVVVDSWRKLVDAAPRDLGPQPMPPTAPPPTAADAARPRATSPERPERDPGGSRSLGSIA